MHTLTDVVAQNIAACRKPNTWYLHVHTCTYMYTCMYMYSIASSFSVTKVTAASSTGTSMAMCLLAMGGKSIVTESVPCTHEVQVNTYPTHFCMHTCTCTIVRVHAQLMRPGIGRNASCAVGDCLTSMPKGRSWPRELWSRFIHVHLHVHVHVHASCGSCTDSIFLSRGGCTDSIFLSRGGCTDSVFLKINAVRADSIFLSRRGCTDFYSNRLRLL